MVTSFEDALAKKPEDKTSLAITFLHAFQRVSNQCRHPLRTLSNRGETGTNRQVHVRKRSALHSPGKAWGGIAAEGNQARSASNVNYKKNNSSDCKLTHRVRLTYSLKSLRQLIRQSNSQEEEKVADMEPQWEIRHSKPRTGTETQPCTASLELRLNVLICAALPFPSQEVPLAEKGTVQRASA